MLASGTGLSPCSGRQDLEAWHLFRVWGPVRAHAEPAESLLQWWASCPGSCSPYYVNLDFNMPEQDRCTPVWRTAVSLLTRNWCSAPHHTGTTQQLLTNPTR